VLECGAVHTVLPHAIRGGGSAVPPLALLHQVSHQSLRTPRVSPHIGRRGQWSWCAGAGPPAGGEPAGGAGFLVGVGVGVGAALVVAGGLVGFTVLVGGAGCAAGVLGEGWMRVAGVLGEGWMRVAGAWVSAGVFGVGARLVGGAGCSAGVFGEGRMNLPPNRGGMDYEE